VEATALKAASDEVLFKESQALQKSWTKARDRNPAEVERLSSAWKVKNGEAEAAKSAFQDAEDRYQKRADQGSRRLSEFSEQVAARTTPITSYRGHQRHGVLRRGLCRLAGRSGVPAGQRARGRNRSRAGEG
jgi:hypothetical protein